MIAVFLARYGVQAAIIAGLVLIIVCWDTSRINGVRSDRDRQWSESIGKSEAKVGKSAAQAAGAIAQSDQTSVSVLASSEIETEKRDAQLDAEKQSFPLSDVCTQCRIDRRRVDWLQR